MANWLWWNGIWRTGKWQNDILSLITPWHWHWYLSGFASGILWGTASRNGQLYCLNSDNLKSFSLTPNVITNTWQILADCFKQIIIWPFNPKFPEITAFYNSCLIYNTESEVFTIYLFCIGILTIYRTWRWFPGLSCSQVGIQMVKAHYWKED